MFTPLGFDALDEMRLPEDEVYRPGLLDCDGGEVHGGSFRVVV
jgi:hypothetical protein